MLTAEVDRLATWATSQIPQLAETACESVIATIDPYRDESLVTHAELQRSIRQNLHFMVSGIAHPDRSLNLHVPEATGRRRAHEGMPLPELLRAYRITVNTMWDALVQRVKQRDLASSQALVTAATRIWRVSDQHAVALTTGYREAMAELCASEQRRKAALVESLLGGHPATQNSPWEAAALLGLPPDRQLVVVAADNRGLIEEGLPGIEERLASLGIASAWRVTPAQHLGIVSLDDNHLPPFMEAVEQLAISRVGVSPTFHAIADAPRGLQLAQAAMTEVSKGQAAVSVFDPSPLAALVATAPGESRRLALDVLGPVIGLAEDDRMSLLQTLAVYLRQEASAEATARELYCHANTVRHRLRRVQELTGLRLNKPTDLAQLAAAVYALRLGADRRAQLR